ncbi:MAG: ATP-binding protein [Planctomycetota bacterium]|jgi:serine/threonine-protein kinase RsbW
MSEECWVWELERVIPSKTGAGASVLQEVLEQLQELGWVDHDVFGIHLAMEEALVNAIRHGNRLDINKSVHFACRTTPDLIRIEITDEGDGFDPSSVPDPTDPEHIECPSGRGLMLMRNFMSRVEYNDLGNRVVMEKERVKKDDAGS